jgi:hypothetical protein
VQLRALHRGKTSIVRCFLHACTASAAAAACVSHSVSSPSLHLQLHAYAHLPGFRASPPGALMGGTQPCGPQELPSTLLLMCYFVVAVLTCGTSCMHAQQYHGQMYAVCASHDQQPSGNPITSAARRICMLTCARPSLILACYASLNKCAAEPVCCS